MDDFFRHIRSFLGLPKLDDRSQGYHEPDDRDSRRSNSDIFLDPLDFNSHFEDQINKMFGEFDLFDFRDIPGTRDIIEFFDKKDRLPFLGENQLPFPDDNQQEGGLRSQFLKPGFERPTVNHFKNKKDIEVKESDVSIDDLDAVVSGTYFKKEPEHPKVTSRFFGKSISTKTIMNGYGGSIEIHKTVRDNEGNEETTITKRLGDKVYTTIKKRDSSGNEEIIENFVNIDEKDVGSSLKFLDNKQWPLYDRFFQ